MEIKDSLRIIEQRLGLSKPDKQQEIRELVNIPETLKNLKLLESKGLGGIKISKRLIGLKVEDVESPIG